MTTRRDILIGSGAIAAASTLPAPAVLGQAKPRVVVIGGGAGGVTAAKYIARDSEKKIAVTLIEENPNYQTCFHSNLFLGGFRDYASILHDYAKLPGHGVDVARARAQVIDRDKKQVVLADGRRIAYDRVVVSPGIDLKYDSVPGWGKEHEERMPHAWKPGAQTRLLKRRLDAVPNGGVIVMIAPPNPFRCPPGPYERISMFAHVLKRTGKTKSKIFIIDPKESFSKQALFQEGWDKHYKGLVEWLGPKVHDGVKSVDSKTGTVVTGFETYKNCALVNVIPAQMAGAIARDSGLANQTGYCPILPESMKSALDTNVFVLGDSTIAGDMPKSAFSANSQAKVAAMTIRGELIGARTFPARYANTCWSLIETEDTVKVGGAYEAKEGKITASSTFISRTGETAELRKQTQAENMGWYAGIIEDMFG
ncbi:MAG: FAD-dependent oxidoreductase [Methylobacterium sp.]|jgi:sulfide dehydrogenase [flavocytochrome c] flavoprotein subunit|nr:FAD-dependent oxidoreductase [Methylobacterium sp.]MCA3637647.1 FAD-dependent oxidoreductase [Methylobacterium sp.]MCA3647152.1 FAD-dependent oxidoreductase [Methylobacterium sp.]MCA3653447.1 FAD-dependent oxidoreductase [Methylobacterium sp.]MCA4921825.1 FAD-dependent oxidoreductase [Methylobacterium sp.]